MVLKLNALEMPDHHYPEKDWLRVYTASSSCSVLLLVHINEI